MEKTIELSEMAERTTFTFQTTPEIKERLTKLATVTRRSKAFLANEAVEQYLAAEEEFVSSIQQGISDADAGQSYTTKEALQNIEQRIKIRASASKSA